MIVTLADCDNNPLPHSGGMDAPKPDLGGRLEIDDWNDPGTSRIPQKILKILLEEGQNGIIGHLNFHKLTGNSWPLQMTNWIGKQEYK